MSGTLEAIGLVRAELEPRGVPVIGFAGAPFTLASYAIEGGSSKDFSRTKAFMLSEPAAWRRLLTKLVTVQADYLLAQARAGAEALQVFDSWAGRAVGREDYLRSVAPFNRELFAAVAASGVPVVNFSLGTSAYLEDAAACGGDVVGLDWQLPLDEAWERVGLDRPVQGNLDPAALLAPWRELRPRIDDVLDRAAGRPGHVFNVGHGLVPQTPVDNVRRLVEHVRERTARDRAPPDRRPRHGVRRARVARGDPRLPRGHPGGPPDAAGGPRRDHGELPRDRRALAAARRDADAGRRARGCPRRRLPVLSRDAPLVAVDRGGRRRDGGGRRHARGRPRARAALQRTVRRALPAEGRGRARALSRQDRVRERAELPRPPRSRGRVRRAGGGGPLPLGGARARPRCTSSSAHTASRCASSRRATPTTSSAARRRGSSRRRQGSLPIAGRGATSPRAGRPSRGPAPTSPTTSRNSRSAASATSSSVPVGFVSDHVELLYDVDVRARAVADRLGSAPRAPARR